MLIALDNASRYTTLTHQPVITAMPPQIFHLHFEGAPLSKRAHNNLNLIQFIQVRVRDFPRRPHRHLFVITR